MKIVIRVDASNTIGRGHAMRCLSLAAGLRQWGNEPVFICREFPGDLIALLRARDYTVFSFSEGDDAEQTLTILNTIADVDTLIVDHYGLDKEWEQKIHAAVSRLVVLDDLADRVHDADVLIDPSLGRVASDYEELLQSKGPSSRAGISSSRAGISLSCAGISSSRGLTAGSSNLLSLDPAVKPRDDEILDSIPRSSRGMTEILDSAVKPRDDEILDSTVKPRDDEMLVQDDEIRNPHLLLGPGYALLSSDYSRLRYSTLLRRQETKTVDRVLVSMGGTDPVNATDVIISALSRVEKSLMVDLVVGLTWPQFAMIKERIESSHHNIQLHIDKNNLASLMSNADLAIGAGGVTSYERCCLGLPSILIAIAENQLNNACRLNKKNAVKSLGCFDILSDQLIADGINALLAHPDQCIEMSKSAATVCDGYGVNRVVSQLLAKKDDLLLRPATFADSDVMFFWQQDVSTRQYARNTEAPSHEQHESWLKKKLNDPNCLFNVMTVGNEPVGVLRFDRVANSENTFEISILVSPAYRKKGYASAALRLSRLLFPNLEFYAEVHSDNQVSHQLFLSTGFVFDKTGYFNKELVYEN